MRYFVLKMGPTDNVWTGCGWCENSDVALNYARHLKKKLGESWRVKIRSEDYHMSFGSNYEFTYDKRSKNRGHNKRGAYKYG